MTNLNREDANAMLSRSKYANHSLKFSGVLRAEALKFRTLLNNWVLLAIVAAVMIGLAFAYAAYLNSRLDSAATAGMVAGGTESTAAAFNGSELVDAAYGIGTSGQDLAVLIVAALAVVFMSNEYGTNQINTTLVAVPKRSMLFLAKWLYISTVTFLTGFLTAAAGYLGASLILDADIADKLEFHQGLLLNWLAVGIYFMFISWLGIGFGALLRNNAGGIVVVVAILFVLPLVIVIFANFMDWAKTAIDYLPSALGRAMTTYGLGEDAPLNYFAAGSWFAGLALAVVLLGYLRFRFTDTK